MGGSSYDAHVRDPRDPREHATAGSWRRLDHRSEDDVCVVWKLCAWRVPLVQVYMQDGPAPIEKYISKTLPPRRLRTTQSTLLYLDDKIAFRHEDHSGAPQRIRQLLTQELLNFLVNSTRIARTAPSFGRDKEGD
mmetsp:Transcript_41728/g.95768  ORF Transcript_41728/g.95768 Transcript_41728/m.95768 type:complete len:135 (-) Transcript_41728:1024-1428(-)